MEAGPRDTARSTEDGSPERGDPERAGAPLSPDGPEEPQGGVTADGPEPEEMYAGGKANISDDCASGSSRPS
jgi:hypothetical protein